jgi:hypothetical protein
MDITPQQDNAGFARWLFTTPGLVEAFQTLKAETQTTIYGEWCGKGIQKGTAISEVEGKFFAVFAIQVGDEVVVEPDAVWGRMFWVMAAFPMIKVIDWYGAETLTLPYQDPAKLAEVAKVVDQMVLAVEACDPWVKANFGVKGVGEGLVFYPVSEAGMCGRILRNKLDLLMFKAKGDKHRVKKSKSAAQIDPDVFVSIQAFVAAFVTEARCDQGLTVACGGVADPKQTGKFLQWLTADVEKESAADLEASGLIWKQVSKTVQEAARDWFILKTRILKP